MHSIALYYKYVNVENPEELARSQRALCERLGLKGRIIIAKEGINGTCEGEAFAIKEYCDTLASDARFADVHFKVSEGSGQSFPKLSIKVRPEIVSGHLGDDDVDPTQKTGTYLKPEELKTWYENGEDFVAIDMRNDYEYISGHFVNSMASGMEYFRDLKKVPEKLAQLKTKKVLTYCTGGIRCEKASAYLLKKGFTDVYQLQGGIVSYMEKYPNQEFKGSLYVFDSRIILAKDNHDILGRCVECNNASERYVNCENDECHVHYILCDVCGKDGAFCSAGCREKVIELRNKGL